MAQANDSQMQAYADQRVRQRAEQARALVAALRDDKAAIDDIYDRAANGAAWNDARDDGPPSLLTSQDMLVYNAVASLLLECVDGTATTEDVGQLVANWPTFMSACVRPIGA
jgi:hypothetical protein